MQKKTFTIDETTALYLRLIHDVTGASASEIIRRSVDEYYWATKNRMPDAMNDAMNKYRVEQGWDPITNEKPEV